MRNYLMSATQNQRYEDEITLIDLAATIVKRRRVFYAVFLSCILVGIAYAFVTENTYQYTSLIQVAEKGADEFLEPPATTIATLESRWLPEREVAYLSENGENFPFTTSFANPENTGLIRLVSESTTKNAEHVKTVHRYLVEQVQQRHNALLEREKRSLESQMRSIDQSIDVLKNGQDSGQVLAEAFDRKTKLESDLQALKAAEMLVLARQGAEKTGPARILIITLATIMALIGGVFSAFFAEFLALVRSQVAASNEANE
ncbi:hypothetical protein Q672_02270 [Marinobacter sp. EVN1]|nr:hypothetical protein Q672_02270 [Marinobacter sp. EVN1]MAC23625.1 lipopolysaccharide biosynthesis protein [Marinobacter sp.]MBH92671.1 lipopolysaccharide biosynthesis protein [Marinobacter sp.]|tara:strand:- start:21684 stop:22463 length:780 start_codon:yes stop_codon:yes gene_type:complete